MVVAELFPFINNANVLTFSGLFDGENVIPVTSNSPLSQIIPVSPFVQRLTAIPQLNAATENYAYRLWTMTPTINTSDHVLAPVYMIRRIGTQWIFRITLASSSPYNGFSILEPSFYRGTALVCTYQSSRPTPLLFYIEDVQGELTEIPETATVSFGWPGMNAVSVSAGIDKVNLTFNGVPYTAPFQAIAGSEIYVSAVALPINLIPTFPNNIELTLNDGALTSGEQITLPYLSAGNTLTAVNTKPTPEITFTFDDNTTVTINEVEAVSGQAYPLSENAAVAITSTGGEPAELNITFANMNTLTLDGNAIENGTTLTLSEGTHTLNAIGATAIPPVEVNGEGIINFTVNGAAFTPEDLPYNFTPQAGRTNSIYIKGQDTASRTLTISGTHIAAMTVNNVEVTLPYTVTITEPLDISVSGEVYQVDVSSKGGAIITKDNEVISNGESLHTILDITKDTFLSIDGTHTLTVTGEDIKTITINGVQVDVSNLPVTINNNNMTATVVIGGYPPSEIHVTGLYIDSATLDGNAVQIGANGAIDLEVTVRDDNHFLTLAGSQPRQYNLTFNTNGATKISTDGQQMINGQILPIQDSKYISALPLPVPIHFDTDDMSIVQVNGVPYYGDFDYNVSSETYIDVNSSSCLLTIDYGDNSYQLAVPRRLVTLTAPHRDGWIFDTWTSNDVGIINPRAVQCNIDLSGVASAHLVANYQRFVTCNMPNPWN